MNMSVNEVAVKFTSIDALEQSDRGGVYCLNITPPNKRSQVIFTVAKTNGIGLDSLYIPAMTYPVELTAQVTKRQLMESSEFRKAVSMRFIRLITKEYYDQLMSEDGAYDIVRRELAAANSRPTDITEVTDAESMDAETQGVNAKYVLMAEQVNSGELTEQAAVREIKVAGNLTKDDAKYLWKKCDTHTSLRNYISQVRELNGW